MRQIASSKLFSLSQLRQPQKSRPKLSGRRGGILPNGRKPGWHRIGERSVAMRSRLWDDSDAEAPRPDASRDLAVLLERRVAEHNWQ
jgi:hypothetical protein